MSGEIELLPTAALAGIVGYDGGGNASRAVIAASVQANGEYLLQNNVTGVNTLIVENLSATGFSAIGAKSVDQFYTFAGVSYEHFMIGFGQGLSLGGQTGLLYLEASRYTATNDPKIPPPLFSFQTTGGIDPAGGTRLSTTMLNGQTSVTVPANSISNGANVSGSGIPANTTVVSGGGTTTFVLSNAATLSQTVTCKYGTNQYAQWNRMVIGNGQLPFDYSGGVSFFALSTGKNTLTSDPFLFIDQELSRVQIGNASYTSKVSFCAAPLNVGDTGTPVFYALRQGFNTYKVDWAASPNRVTHSDGNAAIAVFTEYMDGTGRTAFGGPMLRKGYTVATLPASPGTGAEAYVSDATAPTFLGALTGGGAVVTPVTYNGSAWVAG